MFLVGILSWWYGNGWASRIQTMKDRLASSADFFSVGQLASTVFAPFRQISAGKVSGSIGDQMRAFLDRTVSRFVGAFVRIFMIIFGLAVMLLQIIFGIIVIVVWPILPLFIVIGLIMMVIGWVPQWII
ncbi:MAG TPA: hypothetical protein VMR16_00600 [Candidatus Saccharimonadales bacterium]|nr:hypothetical protein [Candidatus Saccharimonadales bacterium]